MRLLNLMQCGESGTKLGKFLEALMAEFELPPFLRNVARLDMYSNYPLAGIWKEKHRKEMLDMLSIVRDQCRRSGLPSMDAADAVMARLAQPDYELSLLPHHISGLREQIRLCQCKVRHLPS